MIIQVKAESVSMSCDQYAEVLVIDVQGEAVNFKIKLLGTLVLPDTMSAVRQKMLSPGE